MDSPNGLPVPVMDSKVGHMSAATAEKKAAELRRRAEALRANLRRRKAAGRPAGLDATIPATHDDDETRG